MTKLTRLTFSLFLAFGLLVGAATAQDAEVAKAYNDALGKAKAKDYTAAQAAFKQAHQLATQKGESDIARKSQQYVNALYYNIGVSHTRAGDEAAALQAFEEGIQANADSPNNLLKNHKGRATIIKKQGTPEEAMEAWLEVAQVAEDAGQIGELNKALDQAEYPVAQAMEQKNYDDVVTYGNMFLESRETANVHYYMAHTYNQRGQYETALQHAAKALELETRGGNAKAKIKLEEATAYEGLGQFDNALSAYRQCQVGPYKATCDYKVDQLGGTAGQ